MDIDEHKPTMDDVADFVNGSVENVLPGYIRRHRKRIILAVQQASKYRFDYDEQKAVLWGATKVLSILAGGLPQSLPETPGSDDVGDEGGAG